MMKPTVNLESAKNLSVEAQEIIKQITKKNGEIYATKPKKADADSKYVWRMVMFMVSANRVLQCMPVMADLDWWNHKEREIGSKISHDQKRDEMTRLYAIEKEVLSAIPKEQWYSARAWLKAFGSIG
jgi:hypothetical protein